MWLNEREKNKKKESNQTDTGFDKRKYIHKIGGIYHDNIWDDGYFFPHMDR